MEKVSKRLKDDTNGNFKEAVDGNAYDIRRLKCLYRTKKSPWIKEGFLIENISTKTPIELK